MHALQRITLLVLACSAAGCSAVLFAPPPPSQPAAGNPLTREFLEKKAPVAQRAGASYDLSQLAIYLRSDPPPARLEDLGEVKRDLRKLYTGIEAGDVVINWKAVQAQNGVLAYEKKALTERGQVLTHQGVQTMTAAELKAALAGG